MSSERVTDYDDLSLQHRPAHLTVTMSNVPMDAQYPVET